MCGEATLNVDPLMVRDPLNGTILWIPVRDFAQAELPATKWRSRAGGITCTAPVLLLLDSKLCAINWRRVQARFPAPRWFFRKWILVRDFVQVAQADSSARVRAGGIACNKLKKGAGGFQYGCFPNTTAYHTFIYCESWALAGDSSPDEDPMYGGFGRRIRRMTP
ncbi:hypothetical protein C8R44DRAFT_748983 [Mycena epipterygia]|nr:hypothetical protein C8R44DRAFT_748983 [Mycena epipterygia]